MRLLAFYVQLTCNFSSSQEHLEFISNLRVTNKEPAFTLTLLVIWKY